MDGKKEGARMIDEALLIEQLKGYKSEWKLAEPFHEGIASGLQIAIEATERQPKVNEWIPCSERLPYTKKKPYDSVLLQCGDTMVVGFVNSTGQWFVKLKNICL